MSIECQGHFFTIYFPGFVCFVLYYAKNIGEHLQDHWSSGFTIHLGFKAMYKHVKYLNFLLFSNVFFIKNPKLRPVSTDLSSYNFRTLLIYVMKKPNW